LLWMQGLSDRRDKRGWMWAHSSRGTPRVPMMQAADLRDGNNFPLVRRLDAPWHRRIAIQRQMCPGMVIILKILGQDSVQMPFVQHDRMVQTLPAYGADHAFAVRILPGKRRRNEDLLDAHAFDSLLEVVCVDAIAIT
jgi:hypothetical protein